MNELSVGDGFKFGCGFFLAGFVAWIAMLIVMLLFSLVFGGLIGTLYEDLLGSIGLALPLLAIV
jgi:hypothetical protein